MSFTTINPEEISISSDSIVSTLWSNDTISLTNFFQDPTPTGPYLNIYRLNPTTNANAPVEFSVTYGHQEGSGSALYNTLVPNLSPSRVIYGQTRTLITGDENTQINFGNGNNSSRDIFVVNIKRNRYKEKIYPHTFNIQLGNADGTLKLTSDVKDITSVSYNDAGRVFNIVSGSDGTATSTPITSGVSAGYTVSGSYGLFLPDVGMLLLNPRALSLPFVSGGLDLSIDETQTASSLETNNNKLFQYIASGSLFSLNSEETITSDYVFVRVKNSEYNYSTNPSMVDNNGDFIFSSLISNPRTYVTTIGLYNDNNELLAVAKLSKPIKKDFTSEALYKVKLDF